MNIPRLQYLVNSHGGFLQTRDQFEETRKEVNELIAFCEYQAGLIARLIKTLSPEQAGELLDEIERKESDYVDSSDRVGNGLPHMVSEGSQESPFGV
jgi:hypothetical protein